MVQSGIKVALACAISRSGILVAWISFSFALMIGKRHRHQLILGSCVVLFCWLFPFCPAGRAEVVGLDASWQASERGRDSEDENLSAFNQRYHLRWNPQVTRTIFLDTNMDYSRNWTTGAGTREIISPTLDLQLRNDLFVAGINGIITETNNSNSRDQRSNSWEASLGSNWEYPYWPNVSGVIGNNRIRDSADIMDNERSWSELVVDWQLDDFQAYYSYYLQDRTDYAERSSRDERTHFGRIDYTRSFLEYRGQVTFSQQVTRSRTDFRAALGTDGSVNVGVNLSRGFSGVDNTPERGRLPSNPALVDGNRERVAYTVQLHEFANLGVKTDFQVVDLLYLYTGSIDPILLDETSELRWDLYSSSDGIEWNLERVQPATVYNRDENRYEVAVGGLKTIYLKLVVTGWPPVLKVPITEIAAFRTESGSGGGVIEDQRYSKYVTDLNLRFDPTLNTRLIYSLVWDDSAYDPGNNRQRLFQTGSFRWLYNKYFIPTVTINDTATTNSDLMDTLQRSYALSIRSTPIPTLESVFSVTRNENYEDDELINTNHTINLLNSATLYPNLDTTLDLNVVFNNNRQVDSSNEAMGIRWTLTGRLRSSLIMDFITEYGTNTLDFTELITDEDAGGRTTLNINWRPSDLVSVLVNGSLGYGEKWVNYQAFVLDARFSVVRTDKTQVILGYRANATREETLQSLSYNWSWNISRYLTLQSIASYMLSEDDTLWALNAQLTARF